MHARQEHWLRWSWRPALYWAVVAILVNNFIVEHYLAWIFHRQVDALPPDFWNLVSIVTGAGVLARSAEKGMAIWKAPLVSGPGATPAAAQP